MKKEKLEFTFRNIIFYLGGFFFIGFFVNILLRAELGAGAWDTVNYNFQALFPSLTLGMCSFIFSGIVWATVLIYRRQLKYFTMLLPMILVSLSIDLWDLVILGDSMPSGLVEQFGWAILGGIGLPFALSLIVASNFPAFVFDELMMMLKEIFKTKGVAGVRIGIEIFAIVLAIIFWLLAGVEALPGEVSGADIGLGAVSYGTFVLAFTIGPFIQFYLKLLSKMDNKFVKKHTVNLLIYALGMLVIAFGVVMMLKSERGLSSWDTLHWSLHKLTGITVGWATIVVALSFTAFITIVNFKWKYLLMTISIFVVGALIDLFNLNLLDTFEPSNLLLQWIIYFIGLLLLPLGGSLLIISTYPAGVFDEFMLTMMRLLKSDKLLKIRVIMESTAVTIAVILSFIAGEKFGMLNIGTLIFTVSVGFMLKTYLVFFEKVGLYNFKKTDNKKIGGNKL
jgi:uncharacterized membrane protein YczE